VIISEIVEPKELCCPITNKLFITPVSAGDGRIYEKDAIEQWVNEKGCSPTFEKISLKNVVPSNLHKSRVIDFRENRFKKIIYFVELMLDEESVGDVLEKLLSVAEEDSKFLKRQYQYVNVLKSFNNIRKNNLYMEAPIIDLELLFKNLVKYKKYPEAIVIGDIIVVRYEKDGANPEKMEWILKQLVFITDNIEEKKSYKLKLYTIYINGNKWESLQGFIIEHISNLIDQDDKREAVKSGLNELMNVFKEEFNQVKFDILNEVNGRLIENGMNLIALPNDGNTDTKYDNISTENKTIGNEVKKTEVVGEGNVITN